MLSCISFHMKSVYSAKQLTDKGVTKHLIFPWQAKDRFYKQHVYGFISVTGISTGYIFINYWDILGTSGTGLLLSGDRNQINGVCCQGHLHCGPPGPKRALPSNTSWGRCLKGTQQPISISSLGLKTNNLENKGYLRGCPELRVLWTSWEHWTGVLFPALFSPRACLE